MLALTDAGSDYMTVYRNGQEIRSIPITTGKPGFSTRNGIKVVLEQAQHVFMDSSTVGIAANSSNAYHLDVYWDTRVTWSGEYVHAAPWSVGSQGRTNVSHGCINISPANATAFMAFSRIGDVVQVVGGPRPPVPGDHGVMDWDTDWGQWTHVAPLVPVAPPPPAVSVNRH